MFTASQTTRAKPRYYSLLRQATRVFFCGNGYFCYNNQMDKQKKIIIGILAGIIILAGAWYVYSNYRPNNTDGDSTNPELNEPVATVNGEKVTAGEVSEVEQAYLRQGQEVSEKEAIDLIINQKLLSQKIKEEGYSVSDQEAEELIESQLTMQGQSLDELKQELDDQGISYQEQLELIKDDIAIQNYLEDELGDQEFEITDQEKDDFYQLYQEQSSEEALPFEEVEAEIIAALNQQKQQEAIGVLIEELRSAAEIEYL